MHDSEGYSPHHSSDITTRGSREDVARHSESLLLRTTRQIHRLLVEEKNEARLLRRCCEVLAEACGRTAVGIIRIEDGAFGRVTAAGEDGALREGLQQCIDRGAVPACMRGAMAHDGSCTVSHPAELCVDCCLLEVCGEHATGAMRLEYDGRLFGCLFATGAKSRRREAAEVQILEECAQDLAFALHALEANHERNRLESILRESEEHHRQLYQQAPVPYQSLDAEGRILDVNRAWLEALGYDRDKVVGRWFGEFLDKKSVEKFRASFPKFIENGSVNGIVFGLRRSDGGYIRASFDGRIGRDSNGKFRQTFCIFHNLTELAQAQEAARESETRFRKLLESSSTVAVQGYRRDGSVAYWNRASELLYGYSAEEATGSNLFELILPEYMHAEARRIVERAIETGEVPEPEELWLRRKDDSLIPVLSSHTVVDVPHDEPLFFCIDVDLRDVRAAEDELRLRNRAIEAAGNGILVTSADGDMPIVYANPAFERITGYKTEDVLGQNCRFLQDGDCAQEGLDALRKAFAEGRSASVILRNYRKDGSLFWNELSVAPVRDHRGRVTHYVGVQEDVTQRKEAEEALIRSEAKYRAYIDHSPVGIFISDSEGRYVDANPAVSRMLGYTREELLNLSIADIDVPKPGARTQEDFEQLKQRGRLRSERMLLRADGSLVEISLDAVALSDGRYLAFCSDISGTKETQRRLELGAHILKKLNEGAGASFMEEVLGLLRDHVGVKAAAIRLREGDDFPIHASIGMSPKELEEGRSLLARDEQGQPLRGEEGQALLKGVCTCVLSESDAVFTATALNSFWTNDRSRTCERFLRKQDAPAALHECCYQAYESVALIPLRSGSEIVGLLQLSDPEPDRFSSDAIPFLEDMAASIGVAFARQHDEEQLRQSERSLRFWRSISQVFLSSGDADIWHGVVDAMLQALNAQYGMFGYIDDNGDLVVPSLTSDMWAPGSDNASLEPPVIFPRHAWGGLWGRALAEGETLYANEGLHVPEGHVAMENALASAVVHQGEVIGLLAVGNRPGGFSEEDADLLSWAARQVGPVLSGRIESIRHARERKALEEQLRHAQKMEAVGQLAGGVAHDFNNLLQVIGGYTRFAQTDLEEQHPVQSYLEHVGKASERAGWLVNQLLAFSRRQIMRPEPLDLNEVVSGLTKMLNRVLGERIQLVLAEGNLPAHIQGDRGMLEQVLMNLCINARDAISDKGEIKVATSDAVLTRELCERQGGVHPGRYALLQVSDTGCGMDQEAQARIFEPFFTTKEQGKGTGLGLSTVYGIVRQHDGIVTVESMKGEGSVFSVYLPFAPDAPLKPKATSDAEAAGGQETVLIAEDDDGVRLLMRRILEHAGYQVLAAQDGEQALELFAGQPHTIDIAVLDVVMPGKGGFEVLEEMHRVRPDLLAMFASGYSEKGIHENYVLKPGVRLLSKPFGPSELLRALREVLDEAPFRKR